MPNFTKLALVLAGATTALAQGYGDNNPYSNNGGDNSNNPYTNGNNSSLSKFHLMVTAHALLATLAFSLLFPIGGIVIRLSSFPGLWWIHGVFQTLAYILYIAAFAIGVYMAQSIDKMGETHAWLGIALFVVLLFQPVLGVLHHVMFKKYSRRTVWSYGHIWLGRAAITVGMVNAGLGLRLSQETRLFAPSQGTVVAYWVVAVIIWLVYMASVVYGEMKRGRSSAKGVVDAPPRYRQADGEELRQYA
ncbi:hypothetical protein LTR91_018043 [Friedmanniomyces endolithicus]|uniref:Cytochrome b561 domain-containing protein n=1 Tax=Friedmanniomyces endolithicus TaxID=329885 RepID=A0AAN6HE04_9PEZI|nr:hypothetical protein LTR03_011115 [Friedmanniomyces endolithicus]KAK0854261.1 hypothetical protein LTS02_011569 [Friedmanniomyces endolithicus]KAK0872351.1 hypothetical protein LTR87_012460 [Friedmanniomyces endolithicus]KAK0894576.1 hypothetical protein LTR02_012205 [Friedmanniomyces endolithicus]KAK0925128.1 hypothetical protein LTR57_005115 [Friedmanniomyces endolithicus]